MAGEPPESDPVADVMGSLDELAAELESMHEPDQDDGNDGGAVVPPGFDLVTPKPEAVQKLRDAGRDPTATAVRVCPVYRNVRQGQIAKYAPAGLTLDFLRTKLVPGSYDLILVNADNCWIGCRRHHIPDADTVTPRAVPLNGHGNGNGNAHSMGERLLYELAMRGLNGQPDRSSEMEKATAAMVKSMAAMSQMQSMELKQRLMLMERQDTERNRSSDNSLNLLKTILPLVQSRNGNNGKSPQFAELVQAMQLGAQFADAMGGRARENPEDQKTNLERWLLPLAESIGPDVITVLAMLLPPEQRKLAAELLEQQAKTREAEARAAETLSDDPPTVEAEGHTVGSSD